jgi:hypothetical protein
MIERIRSPLWVIPLALIPLGLAWGVNALLYDKLGIGRHRGVYDLLRSDEDVFRSTYRSGAEPGGEQGPPVRWIGSAERPAKVAIVGSSPTAYGLVREQALGTEQRLHVEFINLWENIVPIDRFYDRIKMLLSVAKIDVIVVECNYSFANDYMLGYRARVPAFDTPWNPNEAVYDPEILQLERDLGLPADGVGSPQQYRAALDLLTSQLHSNEWLRNRGQPDIYTVRKQTLLDNPLVLSNHTMVYVMQRIARLCRAHGAGLIAYVPPRFDWLLAFAPPETSARLFGSTIVEPATESRRALRLAARLGGFKVLDYDEFLHRRRFFSDALHLNVPGAKAFSRRFFGDLETALAAAGTPSDFTVIRDEAARAGASQEGASSD